MKKKGISNTPKSKKQSPAKPTQGVDVEEREREF